LAKDKGVLVIIDAVTVYVTLNTAVVPHALTTLAKNEGVLVVVNTIAVYITAHFTATRC
jgi:hypothetical protein